MEAHMLFFLCPLIFLAGFVDSIAGGGGLIALTSYVAFGMNPHIALGTNKFSSCCGTSVAASRYIRAKQLEIKSCGVAVVASLFGSSIGSRVTLLVSDTYLRYLLVILVPIIAVITIVKKDFNVKEDRKENGLFIYVICFFACTVIGFYDGFFGPGTGMFLTFFFSAFVGLNIVKACGNTKVVNLASGVAALTTFIVTGNILYHIAIPCAVCQIAGSYIGSGMAIKGGAKVVRPVMLIVMALLLIKIIAGFFM
jgi:hypothetical protein